MKLRNAAQAAVTAGLATLFGLGACSSTDTGEGSSDQTSCDGAYVDAGGRCRLPNGQFARAACCAVDQAALADACQAYCDLQTACDYDPEPDCVDSCISRGTECTASRLEEFASCPEYYSECDSGEDLFQCADESGCLAEIPIPPDPKEPYEPACNSFCDQMDACTDRPDDFWCSDSCLSSCSIAELEALEDCNAAKTADCSGQDAYVECLRTHVDCIAPPVAPIHQGEGPWGEVCVDYCDLTWRCEYDYSSSCVADCMANEDNCTEEDVAVVTDCVEFNMEACGSGEDLFQCLDEEAACFVAP